MANGKPKYRLTYKSPNGTFHNVGAIWVTPEGYLQHRFYNQAEVDKSPPGAMTFLEAFALTEDKKGFINCYENQEKPAAKDEFGDI